MRALCCALQGWAGGQRRVVWPGREPGPPPLRHTSVEHWHVQKDSLSPSRGRRGWERERSSEEGPRAAPGSSEFSDGDVDTQPGW